MAHFTDLPCEIRIIIHSYVFSLGKIFPYQNQIPIDKNGNRYEAVSHGWLTIIAGLGPNYTREAEQILWSRNLVVFNGYTIRKFFSTINKLKEDGYQAEVLTWLRKFWIKKVSIQFSNADIEYLYAITRMNPVERVECDGIDMTSGFEQKYTGGTSDKDNPLIACSQTKKLMIRWILQARHLAEMQLDRLEVDVEQARVPEPRYGVPCLFKAPCKDVILISACGRLVREFGHARQVVCFRTRFDEAAIFYYYFRNSGVDGHVLYNAEGVLLSPQLREWLYWEMLTCLEIGATSRDYDALWFLTRQISREKAYLNFENE